MFGTISHRNDLNSDREQDALQTSAETDLDCLFLLGSSAAKICTVPWSLDTQMRDASWLKLMLKNRRGGKVEQTYLD